MAPPWQLTIETAALGAACLAFQYTPYRRWTNLFTAFLSLLFLQWTFITLWAVVVYPKLLSPLRHLPHPKDSGSFIHGQLSKLINEPTGIPMRQWINEVPNNGIIKYNTLFNKEQLLITSPAGLKEVLVQRSYDFVKPTELRRTLERLLGFGLMVAEGDEHKVQRRHLMPAFATRNVREIYPIFWAKAAEMVSQLAAEIRELKKEPDGSAVLSLHAYLERVTLDILGVAGLGHDFNSMKDPSNELFAAYRQAFGISTVRSRVFSLLILFLPVHLVRKMPLKHNIDMARAATTIRNVSRQLINEKKKYLTSTGGIRDRRDADILSVALSSGGFSEENLVDQVMTFLAAGHQTLASAMSWGLIEMCRNRDIQVQLRQEIRKIFPLVSIDTNISIPPVEVLESLPYLQATCNEVLRVWSPVPLTRREAAKDLMIMGQFVPKGTDVMISPFAINMSKELWGEDALEFKPERWMNPESANGGAASNLAFSTFLHGPRSCIGQGFARSEFLVLFAAVIRKFEVAFADPNVAVEIRSGITPKPKDGLRIRMKVLEG